MGDRLLFAVVEAAVGEAVRRDVDDAHQHRAVERDPGEGRPLRGDPLEQGGESGVASVRQSVRGEDLPFFAAGRSLDQLSRDEGDRTAGQRQRHPFGDSRIGGGAIEQADRPEIKLRVCHGSALARHAFKGHSRQ